MTETGPRNHAGSHPDKTSTLAELRQIGYEAYGKRVLAEGDDTGLPLTYGSGHRLHTSVEDELESTGGEPATHPSYESTGNKRPSGVTRTAHIGARLLGYIGEPFKGERPPVAPPLDVEKTLHAAEDGSTVNDRDSKET